MMNTRAMMIKNSKMQYLDTPLPGLDLSKIGLLDISVLYFVRHTRRLAPVEPHFQRAAIEIGSAARFLRTGKQSTCPIRFSQRPVSHRPNVDHRLLDNPKGTVQYVCVAMKPEKAVPPFHQSREPG
jgi:hypothetical protein